MTAEQYAAVIAAKDELNDLHAMLIFDNDGGYWQCVDESLSMEQCSAIERELEARFGAPDGYQDLVNLARGAGIDAEWC